MNVLFLTKYGHLGASSRLRSYQYFPYLEHYDITCKSSSLFGDEYLKDRYNSTSTFPSSRHLIKSLLKRLSLTLHLKNYDLVFLENELFPWLPAWGEALFSNFNIPFVVDYDDAIFHKYDTHSSFVVRALLAKKIDTVMRRASLVIAGNIYIAERARLADAKSVEILPTTVDLDRYSLVDQTPSKNFTIGWIGTPITQKYLEIVKPALIEICEEGNCKVVLIGARSIDLGSVPVEILPWSENTEVSDIQKFDVGIMPLPDTPWERGKCGYKLIQYMASGKPVVASPVGVNKQIVKNGLNGYLAGNSEKWLSALRTLRDNWQLRGAMGAYGRAKVEKEYSVQTTAPRLANLLKSVVEEFH